MTQAESAAEATTASVDEIQQGWHELKLRVEQLEAEKTALEQDNKSLRFMLERFIEHRHKSHGELVLLLTGLVSKLPLNDVGVIVSKLVEHNTHVSEVCAVLAGGKVDAPLPQPTVLKALDQTKRELAATVKQAAEELIQLESPLDAEMLRSVGSNPGNFLSPPMVRANRGFIKGQVPRERIVKEFGEGALVFFNDMTTDRKLNPNPKPEEILLGFKNDFEALAKENSGATGGKAKQLQSLYQSVQRSKAATDQARAQRSAIVRLSFAVDLLHYYENQNTEAPDVVFAQRLPVLIEQLVLSGPRDDLDEKWIAQAESLLAHIINPDHRLMVVNNIGKGGGVARTLKYVLRLRPEKIAGHNEVVQEFIRHLLPPPPQKPPPPATLTASLRLIHADMQRAVARAIMDCDRLRKDEADALGKAVGKELGLTGLDTPTRTVESLPPELERQMAWDRIKDLLSSRTDPAVVAAAIRERLHAKYDADESKQSWVTLTEADPIALIRVFCQLPYLADGSTDPIARALMETYVSRLTHEKYAAAYNKIVTSLRNMFRANPASPTLLNFVALVKWVDPEAANKLSADVGLPVAA